MSDLVTIEFREQVADVRLNRPEKYNALSTEMFMALIEAGESLIGNPDVRAVVLSGNGRGFCAGLDMARFAQMDSASGERGDSKRRKAEDLLARDDRPENFAQRPGYVWKRVPVPVIAAIHGVCYGGGLQIALGADIRIAAPDAKLSILEIKWGLIPDMSITQTLRDLVPLDVAKELTFTGRILEGEAARSLGLVTRVAEDPLEAAFELANEIAARSPDAIRFGKRLFETAWHADPRTGLELEAELQGRLIGSPNQVESIRANFEKRAPQFERASEDPRSKDKKPREGASE
jgi:enoyl-CoA hydratase/carnithine racemase